MAFFAGAALAVLNAVLGAPAAAFPGALLRVRQALEAAAACLKREGRSDSAAITRDAVCLAGRGGAWTGIVRLLSLPGFMHSDHT